MLIFKKAPFPWLSIELNFINDEGTEVMYRFCYAAYNSPKFNGFINCTF
jgi:hypothetical protein